MSSSADRELLFGILALQNRVITREQLLAGFDAWSRDKSRSLGEHLVALNGPKPTHLHIVQPLVEMRIEQHGGDPAQSLAGLSSAHEAQTILASISDFDVQASLRHLPSAAPTPVRMTEFNARWAPQKRAWPWMAFLAVAASVLGAVCAASMIYGNRKEAVSVAAKNLKLAEENAALAKQRTSLAKRLSSLAMDEAWARQLANDNATRAERSARLARENAEREKIAANLAWKASSEALLQLAENEYSAGQFASAMGHYLESYVRSLDGVDRAAILRVLDDRAGQGGRSALPVLRHESPVNAVAFSPDGARVLTGSSDETARLWDAATGQPLGAPFGHEQSVSAVAFSPDGTRVLTGSSDKTARLWDAATGKPLGEPLRHEGEVSAVAFAPDGTRILTGSADNTARLWNAATGQPLGKPLRHGNAVTSVAFSPDGKHVLTGSEDKTARLWDAATGQPHGEPLRHEGAINAVAFSPDGTRILTGSSDNTARLWDAATSKPQGEPLWHPQSVSAVAFGPDGTRVLTGGVDHTARLWDTATGKQLGEPFRHQHRVTSVAFSPDGLRVLTGSVDGTARVWNIAIMRPSGELRKPDAVHTGVFGRPGESVHAVAFYRDGKRVVTADRGNRQAQFWDVVTGQSSGKPVRMESNWDYPAVFNTDATRVIMLNLGNSAQIWDVETRRGLGQRLRHDGNVSAAAFSRDGKRVVTGCEDGTARQWDGATGEPLGELLVHENEVNAVAFSPDGTRILTGSGSDWADGYASLWDAATSRRLGEPLRHAVSVRSVAFSPDGKFILTGSGNTALLWDGAMGKRFGRPLRHEHPVVGVSFSPNGALLLTTSGTVARLWDAATCRPLGQPLRHADAVLAAEFSPDGTRLLTGGAEGSAQLWDVEVVSPPDEIRDAWITVVSDHRVNLEGNVTKADQSHRDLAWREIASHPAGQQFLKHQARVAARRTLQAHLSLANAAEAQHDWAAAAFHWRQLDELKVKQSDLTCFDLLDLPRRRGLAEVEHGNWAAAVVAFDCHRDLRPNDVLRWELAACARIGIDREAFLEEMHRMYEWFHESSNFTDLESLCWLSSWCANAANRQEILALAGTQIDENPESWWHLENLGAAQYRVGEFAEAATTLRSALKLHAETQEEDFKSPILRARLFLAMSLHETGDKDEALAEYAAAVKEIDEQLALEKSSEDYPDWQKRVLYKVLREEAEALLKPAARPVPAPGAP